MFKKRSTLVIALLATTYLITLSLVFKVTGRSKRKYKKTLCMMQPIAKNRQGESNRSRVTKDVWVSKPNQTFHYLITSEGSILHLNQVKSSQTKVTEHMKEITCILQQKKFYQHSKTLDKDISMQQVCVLKMEQGSYNYATKNFEGKRGLVYIYQLPGHEISCNISFKEATRVMEGQCDAVYFNFDEESPNLKTVNLEAKIYMAGEAL